MGCSWEPMEAYPRTAAEFHRQFSTEEACWGSLVTLRWPEGCRCPDCGSTKAWRTSHKLFRGGAGESAVSVTAGPLVQDTRKPLRLWFQAWTGLHTRRRAMVRPGHEPRTGEVEVDETCVGGVEEDGGRRHIGNKALVSWPPRFAATGSDAFA
jgi:hypothetical protein